MMPASEPGAILGDFSGVRADFGDLRARFFQENGVHRVEIVETDWVLLDIRVHAIANGFGHGLVHLWAQDGTLLATASQSTILRFHEDFEERRKRFSKEG